jgi:hypothetical protein
MKMKKNSLPSFPLHLTLAVITLLVSNQRGPEADNNNTTLVLRTTEHLPTNINECWGR